MIVKWLTAFSDWVDEADWRSWLVHGVAGGFLALVLGPVFVIAFFALREAEQVAHEYMAEVKPNWLDHVLDIVAPALAALLV